MPYTPEQVNEYLATQGLAPVPLDQFTLSDDGYVVALPNSVATPAQQTDPGLGVQVQEKVPNQPKWKWSWEPQGGLLIWEVDPKYGQPHHIEVTGPNFYNLAQGRVYVDPDGTMEILVWEDRGTEEWQDAAVDDVEDWLWRMTGRGPDGVYYQSEGGYYGTIQPGQTPNKNRMIEAYFNVDFKKLPLKERIELTRAYDRIMNSDTTAEVQNLAADEAWQQTLVEENGLAQALKKGAHSDCWKCGGNGTMPNGLICSACKGTGEQA